jgi:hypothetical protein
MNVNAQKIDLRTERRNGKRSSGRRLAQAKVEMNVRLLVIEYAVRG